MFASQPRDPTRMPALACPLSDMSGTACTWADESATIGWGENGLLLEICRTANYHPRRWRSDVLSFGHTSPPVKRCTAVWGHPYLRWAILALTPPSSDLPAYPNGDLSDPPSGLSTVSLPHAPSNVNLLHTVNGEDQYFSFFFALNLPSVLNLNEVMLRKPRNKRQKREWESKAWH